ncbi:MAG: DUF177 domain-containing protein [Clostridiales bacterium]|nr:DUF177 domain-containing protein [Candidatus Coliplasma equi]
MLDLKKLIDGSVDSVSFFATIDACDLADDVIEGNVHASGEIVNHSGFITLSGVVKPDFKATCARCGKEFLYKTPFNINAKLTDKLANEDEDEFVIIEDNLLDVEELVRSEAVLELPSRFLCKDKCKGLCPKCGCDLNVATCSCDVKDHDPRWDALKNYFED